MNEVSFYVPQKHKFTIARIDAILYLKTQPKISQTFDCRLGVTYIDYEININPLGKISTRKLSIIYYMKITTTVMKKKPSLPGQINDAITGFQHRLNAGK